MLIHEILRESDYTADLEGDLEALLLTLHAKGVERVSTEKVANKLNSQGHKVTASALIGVLDGNPLIQNVSANDIALKNANLSSASGDGDAKQDNEEKVQKMANKAAMKDIKK